MVSIYKKNNFPVLIFDKCMSFTPKNAETPAVSMLKPAEVKLVFRS